MNREKEGANSSIGASPLHIIKRFFSITERLYEYFAKKPHLLVSYRKAILLRLIKTVNGISFNNEANFVTNNQNKV